MMTSEEKLQKYMSAMSNLKFPRKGRTKKNEPKLRDSKGSRRNLETIQKFIIQQDIIGDLESDVSKVGYVGTLHHFAEFVGETDFDGVDEDTFMQYIIEMKKNNWKKTTMNTTKARIRKFYRWMTKDNLPDFLANMKVSMKQVTVKPEDILTEEEIKRMIESTKDPRNKAIISTLYETGFRSSEFRNIKIKGVKRDEWGFMLCVDGKTGVRSVRVVNSIPYLKQWLKYHPDKDNEEAWLFPTVRNSKKKLDRNSFNKLLRKAAERCNINKRVYAHLFRHSRISQVAKKIPEEGLRKNFGWTKDSTMPSIYIHMTGKDVDEMFLRDLYGITDKIQKNVDILVPKVCANCGERNPFDNSYCVKCKFPLDAKTLDEAARMKEKQLIQMMTPSSLEQMIQNTIEKKLQSMLSVEKTIE
ncbi:MAG: tyrosine-type recombinase/integrase [Candidatus Aenigmatarchaeota archaeon]